VLISRLFVRQYQSRIGASQLRRATRFRATAAASYWRQVYDALGAGATMLYGAMFDEVNEGTAMFKMLPMPQERP